MPIRFYIERRTNLNNENAIRISWCFQGNRYQTTLGYSIRKEYWDYLRKRVLEGTHNCDGVKAEDINRHIRRIRTVVNSIETFFCSTNDRLAGDELKQILLDTKSNNFHSELDIVEKWTINGPANEDSRKRYFRSLYGEYYRFVCNAYDRYQNTEYYILQELSGRTKRILIPATEFEKRKEAGSMWPTVKYEEVSEDEALGRTRR